jgi:hypothetical protein
MAATIRYASQFPSTFVPHEHSVSIGQDGIVSVAASFIISPVEKTAWPVNFPVPPGLFSSLEDQKMQGLFVESRQLERAQGLWRLRLQLIGVVSPNVVEYRSDMSPRSFSKSIETSSRTEILSFDYLAETTTATTAYVAGNIVQCVPRAPKLVSVWNIVGRGNIRPYNPDVENPPQEYVDPNALTASPVVLTSTQKEERAGIVRLSVTNQLVYQ